jgi:hypothetical protein
MTDIKPKHGGARQGAGRKPSPDPMIMAGYRVRASQKAIVAANGGAVLVRQLIDQWIAAKANQ